MHPILLVFVGGGLGSLCRWGLSLLIQPILPRFPWATLAANGFACLILGMLLATQIQEDNSRRLMWAVGFCGGFSTFSTFSAETWQLWASGQQVWAALNLVGSLLLCLGCLLLGMKIAG